ncbi:MAG: 30S ribosome-binding factor RbfA [Thermodesulfobacteriota bacterium]|nr:30S ribosome-binding factor RbfA [Thermodesulfobacteriota bacterium]
MKSYPRAERISKAVQREVSAVLSKGLRDPRLEMTTITGVRMSSDLTTAFVYYIVNGDDQDKKAAAEGFKSAGGFIKRKLAKNLKMKYMPDLLFYYDESIDYGENIDRVLESLKSDHVQDDQ